MPPCVDDADGPFYELGFDLYLGDESPVGRVFPIRNDADPDSYTPNTALLERLAQAVSCPWVGGAGGVDAVETINCNHDDTPAGEVQVLSLEADGTLTGQLDMDCILDEGVAILSGAFTAVRKR